MDNLISSLLKCLKFRIHLFIHNNDNENNLLKTNLKQNMLV